MLLCGCTPYLWRTPIPHLTRFQEVVIDSFSNPSRPGSGPPKSLQNRLTAGGRSTRPTRPSLSSEGRVRAQVSGRTSSLSGGSFRVGDPVEGKYKGRLKWYPCVIDEVLALLSRCFLSGLFGSTYSHLRVVSSLMRAATPRLWFAARNTNRPLSRTCPMKDCHTRSWDCLEFDSS